MTDQRPYPELLDQTEQRALLSRAEQLWADLQKNDLGGFSGINRPFWILHQFERVIEEFGSRDVGQSWSKDQLDAHPNKPRRPVSGTVYQHKQTGRRYMLEYINDEPFVRRINRDDTLSDYPIPYEPDKFTFLHS